MRRYWRNADMILDSLDGLVSAVQGKDLGKAEGPSNKLLCKTQEQCDAISSAANACSKRRIDMLQSYDDGCQAVGVMGNTIATLCGCMSHVLNTERQALASYRLCGVGLCRRSTCACFRLFRLSVASRTAKNAEK